MIGLLFGKTVSWNGQARDAQRLPWDVAFQACGRSSPSAWW